MKNVLIIFLVLVFLQGCKEEKQVIQGEVDATTIYVSTKIAGRIENVYVKRGDDVEEKQLIAQISSPELEAKLSQAQAGKDLAKAQQKKAIQGMRPEEVTQAYNTYKKASSALDIANKTAKRVEKLYNEGVLSLQAKDEAVASATAAKNQEAIAKEGYQMALIGTREEDKESAMAGLLKAEATVQEIESYLNETQLESPIKGEISNIVANKGEIIPAGFPIVSIVNMDDKWVVFTIREDILSDFPMGKVFKAKFPALKDQIFDLKISYISPVGSYATYKNTNAKGGFDLKSFEIHAREVKKIDGLRPGMSAIIVDE